MRTILIQTKSTAAIHWLDILDLQDLSSVFFFENRDAELAAEPSV